MATKIQVDSVVNTAGTGPPSLPYGLTGVPTCRYTNFTAPCVFVAETGSPTIVKFSTQSYDTNSLYSPSTGLFTVPSGLGGKWALQATVLGTDDTIGDEVDLIFIKNSALEVNATSLVAVIAAGNVGNFSLSLSDILNLAAGDTIGVYGQTGGHNFTLYNIGQPNIWNYFLAMKVG